MGEQNILLDLRGIREAMIVDLMKRLKAGKITARNLESQRRSAFKGGRKAHKQLVETLSGVGVEGMGHVVEELKRG